MRVAIAQLDPGVPPCRLDAWLDGSGARARLARLDLGEAVPDADAVILLGGRMDAYSERARPAVAAGMRLVERCLRAERPLLAICLGHQLLARVGGGHVAVGVLDPPEGGAHPVSWAPQAARDPVLSAALDALGTTGEPGSEPASWVAESHWDVVDELPAGSTALASSTACAVQAFRVGSGLGVQFHPEADPELIAHWARGHRGGAEMTEAASVRAHDVQIAALGRALTEAFVDVSRSVPRAAAR